MKTIGDVKMMVESYQPWNDQEKQDQYVILKYLNIFDDLLVRDNELLHLTASSWIMNPSHDKVLMIYHNLYDSWGWTGGHADGDADLLHVAIKEAEEETGIQNLTLLSEDILALDILPVWHHVKRGHFVSSHQHANVTYLFEADETLPLSIKPDENKGVMWIPIDHLNEYVSEPDMLPVYDKLNKRAMDIIARLKAG